MRGLVIGRVAAMRAAGAAFLGAGAERFVDDSLDGARAPAAFGAATEAAIDLLGIAGKVRRSVDGAADILVADDVTGTNNHETGSPSVMRDPQILKAAAGCKRKSRLFKQFQTDPGTD